MITFTIYHVPGHKVGATGNYKHRAAWNFRHYRVEPYIIDELELPDTPETWQIVGDLEWEYADEFGYDRGTHYVEARKRIRLISAEQLSANGSAAAQALTFEQKSRGGRIGGKAGGVAATKISMAKGTHVSLQRVKCPHCDKVSNPAGLANHIKHKH